MTRDNLVSNAIIQSQISDKLVLDTYRSCSSRVNLSNTPKHIQDMIKSVFKADPDKEYIITMEMY